MPPPSMPEVVPPIDVSALEMTEAIQRLSYSLMLRVNTNIPSKTWRNLHRHDKAMNNGTQNGYDGGTPHADYINNLDKTASLPRYDKQQRGFGGSFFTAVDMGDRVRCDPGIHGIDARVVTMANWDVKAEEAYQNGWYVTAVNINDDGTVISHFAQGMGGAVVYPFIFNRPIYFWKSDIERWESDSLPDPLKIYRLV